MLGKKVKDTVSDFEGVATCRAEYMNGCVQYRISGKVFNGDTKELWIDENQIEVIGDYIMPAKRSDGGPAVNMPKGFGHP